MVCPSIFRQKKGGMKGAIRSASVNRARNSRDDIDISRRNNRPFAGRATIWNDHRYFISEQSSWPIIFEFAPQKKSLVADHITYAKRTLVYVLFPRCVSSSSSFSPRATKTATTTTTWSTLPPPSLCMGISEGVEKALRNGRRWLRERLESGWVVYV